ncbi:MAG: NPCBM/NEW2 domain-containing protein [Thermoanaerobaculaceae bacterium]|nr:NPCBM/NEW2 domain-containing protein [Thermoanaerobaculaceae bacterium]
MPGFSTAAGTLMARYVGTPKMQGIDQQYFLVELGEWLDRHQASYQRVIAEEFGNQAALFIAAFSGMTPGEFQRAEKTFERELPNGWDICLRLGKYSFTDPFAAYKDWLGSGSPRWLVVTRLGRPEMTHTVDRIESPEEPVFLSEYDAAWKPLTARDGQPIPLSSLTPAKIDCGFAPPKMNRAWDDLPLVLGAVQYASGLGMLVPCAMSFAVPAGVTGFSALVGISAEVRMCTMADVVFELRDQDGRVLYESWVITASDPPRRIEIGLPGVTTLTLAVGEGRNGRDCDHADWVNAAFLNRVPGEANARAAGATESP